MPNKDRRFIGIAAIPTRTQSTAAGTPCRIPLARWYREHGYQFLFIADHEYLTVRGPLNALLGAKDRFLLLPGQEITQWSEDPKRSSAYVNGLFIHKAIFTMGDRKSAGSGCGATVPKDVPLATTFHTNIAAIRAQGGIAQVNHPISLVREA